MKKYLLLILLFALFLTGCSEVNNYKSIKINNKKINVEVADTPEKQYQGLSGRNELCEKCGMLFVFSGKEKPDFVMRNMKFNLDIIWIKDSKIIKIDKNLLAEDDNPKNTYSSPKSIDYVLEVNANFCDQNNIKEGDLIIF